MMRIGSDPLRISPAANGEQHNAASALSYRVGDRERQCSTAADHGERTIVRPVRRACVAHGSSSADPRRIAIVNGRDPARMKAITLATSGMLLLCAAT